MNPNIFSALSITSFTQKNLSYYLFIIICSIFFSCRGEIKKPERENNPTAEIKIVDEQQVEREIIRCYKAATQHTLTRNWSWFQACNAVENFLLEKSLLNGTTKKDYQDFIQRIKKDPTFFPTKLYRQDITDQHIDLSRPSLISNALKCPIRAITHLNYTGENSLADYANFLIKHDKTTLYNFDTLEKALATIKQKDFGKPALRTSFITLLHAMLE